MNHTVPEIPKIIAGKYLLVQPEALQEFQDNLLKSVGSQIFTEEQIEIIYSIGHSLFSQGKYEEARNIFQILLIYRPLDAKYLFAYGLSCKNLGNFSDAIPAFVATIGIEPDNIKSACHLAECLVALGRKDECLSILDPVIEFTELDESYFSLRKRAEAIRFFLTEKKK